MVTLTDIQSYFVFWYRNLLHLWDFLTNPGLSGYLQNAADSIAGSTDTSWIASTLLSGISSIVALLFGTEASLLNVLLGGSLAFFILYQLIVWLLNIVT